MPNFTRYSRETNLPLYDAQYTWINMGTDFRRYCIDVDKQRVEYGVLHDDKLQCHGNENIKPIEWTFLPIREADETLPYHFRYVDVDGTVVEKNVVLYCIYNGVYYNDVLEGTYNGVQFAIAPLPGYKTPAAVTAKCSCNCHRK